MQIIFLFCVSGISLLGVAHDIHTAILNSDTTNSPTSNFSRNTPTNFLLNHMKNLIIVIIHTYTHTHTYTHIYISRCIISLSTFCKFLFLFSLSLVIFLCFKLFEYSFKISVVPISKFKTVKRVKHFFSFKSSNYNTTHLIFTCILIFTRFLIFGFFFLFPKNLNNRKTRKRSKISEPFNI